ncbi:MAG TPA: hypothetical protein VMS17_24495 [Gemmataceae bacterium]|nr:hypothetical protein [Gemmataceae bacterium]
MKESVTYQAIVEEGVAKGRQEGARRTLLCLGEELFGKPACASVRSRIESINSLDTFDHLIIRMLRVHRWEDLLADTPTPEPRRGRRKKR